MNPDLTGQVGMTAHAVSTNEVLEALAASANGLSQTEAAARLEVYNHPRHPYTRELLDARPVEHLSKRHAEGEEAVRSDEGVAESGCAFRLRCPFAQADCAQFDGVLRDTGHADGDHGVACLHPL